MHFIVVDLIVSLNCCLRGIKCFDHYQYANEFHIFQNIPIFSKEADKVVHAHLVNLYSKVDGSHKMLSNNGSEFKKKIMNF